MSGADDVPSAPAAAVAPETAIAPTAAGGNPPDATVEIVGADAPHRDRSWPT